ncbi:MAG: phage head closure protein [Ruminococcus flavefaciens]|nr:phage head closure protein [Ruminococcus flavefaciens]MCM1232658.1 phage head closure protein [Ruminococcus flavefaciens]
MAYTHKIAFQILAEITDEIGNQIPEWTTVFTAWANINGVGGREYYSARQTNSENDMIFRVRYSRKIADYLTSEIRIVYGNRIFDVKHVDDYMELHRELVFRTQELNGGKNYG